MISNERQYRITKAEAEKFKLTLSDLEKGGADRTDIHPRLIQAEREALQSQLDELNEEISEYELLKSGKVQVITINSFNELADGLIKGRIAAGLSQKALAERLHLKEQQIQRYESERYASASLQRLQEIARAIGVEIRKEILMPLLATNFDSLAAKLNQAGLDKDFLRGKLLPTVEAAKIDGTIRDADEKVLVAKTADIVGRIFGWTRDALLASAPLAPPRLAAAAARFKIPIGRTQRATSLYAAYANYLAVVVLNACEALPREPIPSDSASFRAAVVSRYGSITLPGTLNYAWDLGVPVIPLRDRGAFHGACWRYEGRNIVILKQNSRHLSRWLFDLIHELFHASQNPEQPTLEVIEADENSAERRNSNEEVAASQFAGDVVLNGRAEELAEACVKQAHGSVERLKGVLPTVARENGVEVGSLANYMAFRLSWQGLNWWGAASNLQMDDDNPWEMARDVFLKRFPFEIANDVDRQLLSRALQ
jgi:transcriptional regulator with XRE-family HTH domain